MLSISKRKEGSHEYFLSLIGYYARGRKRHSDDPDADPFHPDPAFDPTDQSQLVGEPPGKWLGTGAWKIGLTGIVDPDEFIAVMAGRHPETGEPQVQNVGRPGRNACYDMTLSAPKAVSVAWARATGDLKHAVYASHRNAVHETAKFFEGNFSWSRTGRQGSGAMVKADCIFADFPHHTNRADEPQLHDHLLLINWGICSDGVNRAIDGRPVYGTKMLVGAYYRAILAHDLHQLGFQPERHGNSFTLRGIPQKIIDAHSTRRKEIEKLLHQRGLSGSEASEIAAFDTRKARAEQGLQSAVDRDKRWAEFYDSNGWIPSDVAGALADHRNNEARTLPKIIDQTLSDLLSNRQHFTEREFITHAIQVAAAYGIHPTPVIEAAKQTLSSDRSLNIPVLYGPKRYTTKEALERETEFYSLLDQLFQTPAIQIDPFTIYNAINNTQKRTGNTLKPEQRQAAKHFAAAEGAIRVVTGFAGTGKTTYAVGPAIEAFQSLGYHVVGTSFSNEAKNKLQGETGIPCHTVTTLLGDWQPDIVQKVKRELGLAIRQNKNPPNQRPKRNRPKPIKLPNKSVIVVDEASMISLTQWIKLLRYAIKYQSILLVMGDSNQIDPVEGVPALLAIAKRLGGKKLVEIVRQKEPWQRQASRYLAEGDAVKALEIYAQRGCIHPMPTIEEALDAAIDKWEYHGGLANPENVAIIAHINNHVDHLNHVAQQRRLKNRNIRGMFEHISHETADGVTRKEKVYIGEPIVFTENHKRYEGIRKGTRATVIGMKPMSFEGTLLRVLIEEKKNDKTGTRTLDIPATSPGIRLGYAGTNFKWQGGTVKNVVTIAGGNMQDLPATYVQHTRHKEGIDIFTTQDLVPDLENIAESPLAAQAAQRPDHRLIKDLLEEYKVVHEPNRDVRINKCLYDHYMLTSKAPHRTAIITHSTEEAKQINDEIQSFRIQSIKGHQRLGSYATVDENRNVDSFRTKSYDGKFAIFLLGDRVRFTMGTGHYKKGQLGTVSGLAVSETGESGKMAVELDDGRIANVFINTGNDVVKHAYAITTSDARGMDFLKTFELPPDPIMRQVLRYRENTYRIGDQVRITGDVRKLSLRPDNGEVVATQNERATITHIYPRSSEIVLTKENGDTVHIKATKSTPPLIEKLATDFKELTARFPKLTEHEIQLRTTDEAFSAYQKHHEQIRKSEEQAQIDAQRLAEIERQIHNSKKKMQLKIKELRKKQAQRAQRLAQEVAEKKRVQQRLLNEQRQRELEEEERRFLEQQERSAEEQRKLQEERKQQMAWEQSQVELDEMNARKEQEARKEAQRRQRELDEEQRYHKELEEQEREAELQKLIKEGELEWEQSRIEAEEWAAQQQWKQTHYWKGLLTDEQKEFLDSIKSPYHVGSQFVLVPGKYWLPYEEQLWRYHRDYLCEGDVVTVVKNTDERITVKLPELPGSLYHFERSTDHLENTLPLPADWSQRSQTERNRVVSGLLHKSVSQSWRDFYRPGRKFMIRRIKGDNSPRPYRERVINPDTDYLYEGEVWTVTQLGSDYVKATRPILGRTNEWKIGVYHLKHMTRPLPPNFDWLPDAKKFQAMSYAIGEEVKQLQTTIAAAQAERERLEKEAEKRERERRQREQEEIARRRRQAALDEYYHRLAFHNELPSPTTYSSILPPTSFDTPLYNSQDTFRYEPPPVQDYNPPPIGAQQSQWTAAASHLPTSQHWQPPPTVFPHTRAPEVSVRQWQTVADQYLNSGSVMRTTTNYTETTTTRWS